MPNTKKFLAGILLGIVESLYLGKPYNDKASRLIDRLVLAEEES